MLQGTFDTCFRIEQYSYQLYKYQINYKIEKKISTFPLKSISNTLAKKGTQVNLHILFLNYEITASKSGIAIHMFMYRLT